MQVIVASHDRAGQILSEASTITGDPANGTVTYGYDPLGQLTAQTLGGITTVYGWDATTNRTSVQVGGGTAATTAYDAANRPTAGATPTASYASDDDGRLIARPGQTMTWDHLGRLTAVTDAAGTATYTYDPLDRLRTVDDGGGNRIRFRYVGLTTQAAQWLDDVAGTVTRSIGNGWGGERLLDWTGTSSSRRYYGTNAHHDVTWLADSTGAVSQSLRYDPWGTPRSTVPTGYTPFRFQGSWYDATTDLSWVVTRWYAPSLGRFVSEDTLLGEPREPDSRHLYAYAAGEPVGAWDPDGQAGCVTYPKLYGAACSSYARAKFTPRFLLRGSMEIGLFIKSDKACFVVCLKGDGDDRRWSSYPHMDNLHARGWLRIGFDYGTVRAITRPSCGVDHELECNDALPIRSSAMTSFDSYLVATDEWPYGVPKITGCDKSYVAIHYGFKQSFTGLPTPSINGFVKARRCNRYNEIVVQGDGYPWFEMSYSHRDGSGFSYRVYPAGGLEKLADGLGDWKHTFKVTQK